MSASTDVRGESNSATLTSEAAQSQLVIDTDVHERGPLTDLVPYLDPKWHKHITQYGWTPEYLNPYAIPSAGGLDRADAKPTEGGPGGSDAALLRQQVFEEAGIGCAILTGRLNASTLHPGWSEFKTALMAANNDWIIDQWLAADDRLLGSIHVNAHDPQGAAREIERLGEHPRMAQVMIYMGDKAFGEPYYHPIYEAAQRKDIPVAFHQSGNSRTALGYHRYYIEWKTLVPQVFMSTLTSLIFNGVFDKYPQIRVIMVEGAFTWVPHFMSRADQHLRQLHGEVPWVKRFPSDIIRSQVRFSTQPMEEMAASQFLEYIDLMGSEELLCYSSDYPHWDFDSPLESLPGALPAELKAKILNRNAVEFYGSRLQPHLNRMSSSVQMPG